MSLEWRGCLMNGFVNSLKRFIKNKNTITIIGVIAIVGILYFIVVIFS